MNIKKTSAQPAKEVTGAQATKTNESTTGAAEKVQNLIQSAGLKTEPEEKALPAPKPEPVPVQKKLTLAEREKAIRENADRLKGLNALRTELDMLRSWGFADNGNNASLKISGDQIFTTSNTRLISRLKTTLEDLFEDRIKDLEIEIQNAEI